MSADELPLFRTPTRSLVSQLFLCMISCKQAVLAKRDGVECPDN